MKIEWDRNLRTSEFNKAKQHLRPNGQLKSDGTKLRRQESKLSRSFMIVDGKILAIHRITLGKGVYGKAKLAEDETGRLYALKILAEKGKKSKEAEIAYDLGISDKVTSRETNSTQSKINFKKYIPYQYLGTAFYQRYFEENKDKDLGKIAHFNLDERLEISIKLSILLCQLHAGRHSKTQKNYLHGDFHNNNITVDDNGNYHVIDFGLASSVNQPMLRVANADFNRLRAFIYTPSHGRSSSTTGENIFYGVLGTAIPEYELVFGEKRMLIQGKPWIGTYEIELTIQGNALHYRLTNSDRTEWLEGNIAPEVLGLDTADIHAVFEQNEHPKQKIANEHIQQLYNKIEQDHPGKFIKPQYNPTLMKMLHNPDVSLLEWTKTLTFCRLHLENAEDCFAKHSDDACLDALELLNAQANLIMAVTSDPHSTPDLASIILQHAFDKTTKKEQILNSIADNALKEKVEVMLNGMDRQRQLMHDSRELLTIIHDIQLLKKNQRNQTQEKLDRMHHNLYVHAKEFLETSYKTSQERLTAMKSFESFCENSLKQAQIDFKDNAPIMHAITLCLSRIVGVILAIATLGIGVYLYGGLDAYQTRFFRAVPSIYQEFGTQSKLSGQLHTWFTNHSKLSDAPTHDGEQDHRTKPK